MPRALANALAAAPGGSVSEATASLTEADGALAEVSAIPVDPDLAELAAQPDSEHYPAPLPITRRDEIGNLIGGFNRLLESLKNREAALQKSEEDLSITRRLVEVGELVGIGVLDHVIVASRGTVSFRTRELL